jgi:GMP synthase-like glutamine amidotransferase
MKVLLIDNGTILLDKLQKLIPGNEITKNVGDIKASDALDFDLIVLSGSSKNNVLYNKGSFNEEIKIIGSGKPILGICFGCELVGYAFGAELKKLPEKQQGIYEVEILDKSLGMRDIKVYEGHRWVISKLPKVFDVLAKSENGPEIVKHKTLPIYGLQFHPENMVEETEGDELFLKLLSRF